MGYLEVCCLIPQYSGILQLSLFLNSIAIIDILCIISISIYIILWNLLTWFLVESFWKRNVLVAVTGFGVLINANLVNLFDSVQMYLYWFYVCLLSITERSELASPTTWIFSLLSHFSSGLCWSSMRYTPI